MTAGDAAAEDPRRPVDAHHEDDGIDVSHYARLLWQHRLLIVTVMIAGGAVGWAVARFTPPRYLATARLAVQAPGSAAATDALTRYQAALENEIVLSTALKTLGLENVTAAQVRSALSSRVGAPPNTLLVELRWDTPDPAARIVHAVAQQALEGAHEEVRKAVAIKSEAIRIAVEEADLRLAKAQRAELELRQSSPFEQARTGQDAVAWRRRDLFLVMADIPAERGRLKIAEQELAKVPPTLSLGNVESSNPVHVGLALQVSAIREHLAALEAKRDYLLSVGQSSKGRASQLNEMSAFEFKHGLLQADVERARRLRDQLGDSASELFKQSISPEVGLQYIDEPDSSARRVFVRTSSSIARGLAMGLMLAVAGVIFLSGLPRPLIGRRA